VLALPELTAVELDGERLNVVATTSIIGDVVSQVGKEMIELTTLIGTGQDSHSYEPSPQDLQTAADADVIFVNGWDLEEGLAHDLEEIAEGVAVVPISANIEPLIIEGDEHEEEHEGEAEEHVEEGDEHQHSGADPHVWFSIQNVEQWVENVTAVLSELDPANAETYETNAAAYTAELAELAAYVEAQIAQLPEANRLLITNHDSFSYFTRDYHFEVLGTIIPSVSTAAEPSAGELAGLVETMEAHGLCTIFTETSVSDSLAQTVAAELDECETVTVVSLYTESIGAAGSGADSYIGMYRANVDAIVAGLQ
jgi:ABC-type Zn uptake system ZnuABC Zn-binding protein ZnuA